MSITSKSKQGKEIVLGDVFIDFYGDSSVHVVLDLKLAANFHFVVTMLDQQSKVSREAIYKESIYEVACKS